jgi:hypothetical protein
MLLEINDQQFPPEILLIRGHYLSSVRISNFRTLWREMEALLQVYATTGGQEPEKLS